MSEPKGTPGCTPGPWKAVRREIAWHEYPPPQYRVFAPFVEPLGLQVYGPDWSMDGAHDGPDSNFIPANARLIAAAPDLAAVSIALVAWDRWQMEPTPANAVSLRITIQALDGSQGGALAAALGRIIVAARAALSRATSPASPGEEE